jgi:molybdenum cofactor cytidylyltransferase
MHRLALLATTSQIVARLYRFWVYYRLPPMDKKIRAIVLAAGASTRMGQPKQLLPYGRLTVLQTVLDVLLGCPLDGIVVVLGHNEDAVRGDLGGQPVTICRNPFPDRGMFSSVLCGLGVLPDGTSAALFVLGDQPWIRADVVQGVVEAYRRTGKGIIVPVHNGRRGHPTLIDLDRYGDAIRDLDGDSGLKPLVRGYPGDTLEVPVSEKGILTDLDTPDDYRRALEELNASEDTDHSV